MLRYFPVFCLLLLLFALSEVLGNSKVKPRTKRSNSPNHLSNLSVKDLAVELAKKHLIKMILDEQQALDKAKESAYILQRDSCTNIKSIGKPVTHNAREVTQGAWMKDPLGIMGTETIFVMRGYSGKNALEEFENMDMFKAGVVRKTYILPYNWDGTGAVVYGPFLYYNRESSPYIVKFNVQTGREEAQITISGFTPRKNHYQWGGYSAVDLAVDEQGLWVLWGDQGNSYRLHAYKIDVFRNVITDTYTLATEAMSQIGNAFVACGVIYCIDNCNFRSTTINFAYDTKTGKQWNPNIQFTNQYGYNSMVDYNPRERVLYAWDNKRLVTYPITFEEH